MTESMELSASPVGLRGGQAARRISRLLRAQRLESVAALAAGISHDLNNVLAAVLLTADVLAQHARAPAAERALAALDELATQGIALTKQILFLARGLDGEPAQFDLRHLLTDVRRLARVIFPPPATVLTSYPDDLWLVTGDALLVYQLLLESCREARRSCGPDGRLRISARNAPLDESQPVMGSRVRPGPYVLVEVATEDGTGDEPVRPPAGSGAGAPWPSVSLRQRLEGGGALFALGDLDRAGGVLRVHLPAILQAGTGAAAAGVRLSPGRGERILVIEDDAALRELLVGSLEGHGYQVESSGSGLAAVALMARRGVKVALVPSPGSAAPRWSRALLAAADSRAIPVVVLRGGGGSAPGAPPASASLVLEKPFTVAELLSKVGQALSAAAASQGASAIWTA